MYTEIDDEYAVIKSNKKELSHFNGMPCRIINHKRNDGLIEVYILGMRTFLLVSLLDLDWED